MPAPWHISNSVKCHLVLHVQFSDIGFLTANLDGIEQQFCNLFGYLRILNVFSRLTKADLTLVGPFPQQLNIYRGQI